MQEISRLYPAGSVVKLEGGSKRVMIIGIKQTDRSSNTEYDYSGVPYPEGNLGENLVLFNQSDIKEVFFIGYNDIERESFIDKLSEYYKKKK